jgi:capsular polysaccharide transport system permease protein
MFFAVLSAIKQETKWVLNVILKPMYFLSAIMYSVATIPGEYQKFLLLNPLVHSIGLMRSGFIENYDSYYVDSFYLFMWCLVTLFLGIASFVAKEHRLRMG